MTGRDAWWDKLARAEARVVEALRGNGVTRVEHVVGFGEPPRHVSLWLVTTTDRERDALPADNPFLDVAKAAIEQAGLTPADVSELMTLAQSEETVAREYRGGWFYALR